MRARTLNEKNTREYSFSSISLKSKRTDDDLNEY